MVMNGCEAESKTSSGPRGLSTTQRGNADPALASGTWKRVDETWRVAPSTEHTGKNNRPLRQRSTLYSPRTFSLRNAMGSVLKYIYIQSKNKYAHVCFSFINFIVYAVSEGLSWEFPCPLTYTDVTDVWLKKCVLRLHPHFTCSTWPPDAYICFASYVFGVFFTFFGKYSTGYSIMVCVMWMI